MEEYLDVVCEGKKNDPNKTKSNKTSTLEAKNLDMDLKIKTYKMKKLCPSEPPSLAAEHSNMNHRISVRF